tara:strand:+ start:104 stop:679 length:576 start_codon:yes stop_codon:yes gene_type:complete
MNKLFYNLLIISYMTANPFDTWVDQNKNVINKKIKSVSFQISLRSGFDLEKNKILNGQIVIGNNKQFRFEMGTRTVISDGTLWKSYDERTDQIFIQDPDKKLEKALFSWTKVKKLKDLPIRNKPDGGYKIKLFSNNNDIRAYFNSVTNDLDSILISQRNGFQSKIINISITEADSVLLNIGTESSTLFDLR